MLWKTKDLKGRPLAARDGEVGKVKDFYFSDADWTVRYLVADTGTWLAHRKVLISPFGLAGVHTEPHRAVEVNLTRQQVEESPPIEAHQPVSRQYEARYHQYYGWPYYWPGPLLWGPLAFPAPVPPVEMPLNPERFNTPPETEDSHLRSVSEVTGYSIQALDRPFGHVEQFIVEDKDWTIRYLVVDTRDWFPGKRVLVSPQWISNVSWPEFSVYVELDQETIKRSPAYDPGIALTREYEMQLHDHYGRLPYWENEGSRLKA